MKYELDFIFGLPGDNEDTYKETIDVLKRCNHLNRVSALIISFLPKTEIIKHSLQYNDIIAEDIDKINQGLESSQTDKGSIRNIKKKKLSKQYNLLYRLCAFLPTVCITFLQKSGLFKLLIYLNPFLIYFIRILGMDTVDKIFVRSFLRQFVRCTFRRDKYYST